MAFFKRVFSADYRRGLAAEASGEYAEAARAYALAGERHKVAEMHLLAAERAGGPEARLVELRSGVRWADGPSDEAKQVRRRIARAMLNLVRAMGVISDSDRAILREAAALFQSADDAAGAGECHELAGDELQAAESYQRAGEVERLEQVLQRDEARRREERRLRDSFEEYQLYFASGERDSAIAALETCLEARREAAALPGRDPGAVLPGGEYDRLLESIRDRRLASSKVTLSWAGERVTYVGAFPLGLGREASCEVVLRDGGISRRHAEILEAGGRFRLRDCASKNGTFLAGCAVDGELPLEGEGEIGLGEVCAMRFRVVGGAIHLDVTRGIDRGLRVVAAAGPIAVAGGKLELRFDGGRPMATAPGGQPLALNGTRAGHRVQLLRGDVVEIGEPRPELRVEVAG